MHSRVIRGAESKNSTRLCRIGLAKSKEIHRIHWADRRRTSPASQHCSLTRLGANGTHTEAPTNSLSEHSNASNETEPRRILNPGLYLG